MKSIQTDGYWWTRPYVVVYQSRFAETHLSFWTDGDTGWSLDCPGECVWIVPGTLTYGDFA